MFRNVLTPPATAPGSIDAALADAAPTPFWLDDPARPGPRPRLRRPASADLAIVGGGYSGLWTALLARERRPGLGHRAGRGSQDRLGGQRPQRRVLRGQPDPRRAQRAGGASPTRWTSCARSGRANLDEIEQAVAALRDRLRLRARRRAGRGHRAAPGRLAARVSGSAGTTRFLDARRGARRGRTPRPTWPASGDRDETALVDPARLAWGLAPAAECARACGSSRDTR